MRKHDDNVYNRCGLTRHWSCTYRMQKHFVDHYQTFLKGKGNNFETHSTENALVETDIEVNNTLIMEIPSSPIEEKTREVSDSFEDPDGKEKSSDWWKSALT